MASKGSSPSPTSGKHKRRSSGILKNVRSPNRKALVDIQANAAALDNESTLKKVSRRVSFADMCTVKEYMKESLNKSCSELDGSNTSSSSGTIAGLHSLLNAPILRKEDDVPKKKVNIKAEEDVVREVPLPQEESYDNSQDMMALFLSGSQNKTQFMNEEMEMTQMDKSFACAAEDPEGLYEAWAKEMEENKTMLMNEEMDMTGFAPQSPKTDTAAFLSKVKGYLQNPTLPSSESEDKEDAAVAEGGMPDEGRVYRTSVKFDTFKFLSHATKIDKDKLEKTTVVPCDMSLINETVNESLAVESEAAKTTIVPCDMSLVNETVNETLAVESETAKTTTVPCDMSLVNETVAESLPAEPKAAESGEGATNTADGRLVEVVDENVEAAPKENVTTGQENLEASVEEIVHAGHEKTVYSPCDMSFTRPVSPLREVSEVADNNETEKSPDKSPDVTTEDDEIELQVKDEVSFHALSSSQKTPGLSDSIQDVSVQMEMTCLADTPDASKSNRGTPESRQAYRQRSLNVTECSQLYVSLAKSFHQDTTQTSITSRLDPQATNTSQRQKLSFVAGNTKDLAALRALAESDDDEMGASPPKQPRLSSSNVRQQEEDEIMPSIEVDEDLPVEDFPPRNPGAQSTPADNSMRDPTVSHELLANSPVAVEASPSNFREQSASPEMVQNELEIDEVWTRVSPEQCGSPEVLHNAAEIGGVHDSPEGCCSPEMAPNTLRIDEECVHDSPGQTSPEKAENAPRMDESLLNDPPTEVCSPEGVQNTAANRYASSSTISHLSQTAFPADLLTLEEMGNDDLLDLKEPETFDDYLAYYGLGKIAKARRESSLMPGKERPALKGTADILKHIHESTEVQVYEDFQQQLEKTIHNAKKTLDVQGKDISENPPPLFRISPVDEEGLQKLRKLETDARKQAKATWKSAKSKIYKTSNETMKKEISTLTKYLQDIKNADKNLRSLGGNCLHYENMLQKDNQMLKKLEETLTVVKETSEESEQAEHRVRNLEKQRQSEQVVVQKLHSQKEKLQQQQEFTTVRHSWVEHFAQQILPFDVYSYSSSEARLKLMDRSLLMTVKFKPAAESCSNREISSIHLRSLLKDGTDPIVVLVHAVLLENFEAQQFDCTTVDDLRKLLFLLYKLMTEAVELCHDIFTNAYTNQRHIEIDVSSRQVTVYCSCVNKRQDFKICVNVSHFPYNRPSIEVQNSLGRNIEEEFLQTLQKDTSDAAFAGKQFFARLYRNIDEYFKKLLL